jgi:DNA-binding MarR family transcriptional regulator
MARSPLQEEIKKRHPFACPEEEATLNLVRTLDHLQQEWGRLFVGHGVTGPQYNVLRILRGTDGHGLPCQEIAGRMVTRMPDVTRLVDRLVAAGLVERRRTVEDRRVVLVTITRRGLDLLARLDEPVQELHRLQLGHLSRAELAELNRLLVKVRWPDGSPGRGTEAPPGREVDARPQSQGR